jgi:hypothetical protein
MTNRSESSSKWWMTFSETHIDQENQNDHTWIMQEGEDPQEFQEKIANHRMLVLKNNQIPKGLIPLERLV